MSTDLKKIVGRARRMFYIEHKGELSGKCLGIAIIIDKLCKIYNIKCDIIKKYISEDKKSFYQHFMVTDGSVVYDTTLIDPAYVFDFFEGENELSQNDKEYEYGLAQQYNDYLNNSYSEIIDRIINFYLPKIDLN